MSPLPGKKVLINGHHLCVEQDGLEDGPVVVLLHHGLGSVRAWRRQMAALVAAGYQVMAYDRWGYGGSDARPRLDVPAFRTDLEDLHRLLEQLNFSPVALVGHSDGGTIALYYAMQQPQRVSCLVIVAAHIYLEPKMEPGMQEIGKAFETDERFQKSMRSIHGEKVQSVFHNWYDGWQRVELLGWDMRPLLGQVKCPALIVQGMEDEYATPQHAQDLSQAIPGAELYLLPGGRHMLPQEHYAEFNQKMLHFLEDHVTNVH